MPLILVACLTKPTSILSEWMVTTHVSRALNLEFDRESFSNKLHITSKDNWFFRLKLIPVGLSFWFTWLYIFIPNISLSSTLRNVCSMRSFTMATKFAAGLLLYEGGIKRTVSCLPTAFYRLCSLVFASKISNLRTMISLYIKIHNSFRLITSYHLYHLP